MTKPIVYFLLITLAGCTSYQYQGSLVAPDTNDVDREVVLYWNKTKPLLGEAKASELKLLICDTSISFVETDNGIVFRGAPDRDIIAATGQPATNNSICGRVLGEKKIVDIDEQELSLTISCLPKNSEFSVSPRIYIKAKDSPYKFNINVEKEWSFFGKTPEGVTAPKCVE